jgi:hypothetical protein
MKFFGHMYLKTLIKLNELMLSRARLVRLWITKSVFEDCKCSSPIWHLRTVYVTGFKGDSR